MVGASHDFNYFLWKPSSKASEGLQTLLDKEGNTTMLEREIINSVSLNCKPAKKHTVIGPPYSGQTANSYCLK